MRIKQVIGLVILFIGPFSIPSSGQVVATWTDSSGNWSNSANWSTLTVPNNGGGKTYDVVINGTGADTVTFDVGSTTINSLTLGTGETFQPKSSSQTLTAGGITNTGTFYWGGSLNIGSLSNDGTVDISGTTLTIGGLSTEGLSNNGTVHIGPANLAIGSISLGTLGEVSIEGCTGTIGGVSGGIGSVFEIGFSSLTLGDSLFVQGSSVSIDSSAVIGGLGIGSDGSRLFIRGSSVIGGFFLGFGSSAIIDNSTLVGGIITEERSNASIQNGSAVIAGGVGNSGTIIVDQTSSLVVLGDFLNQRDGTAGIAGAFIVDGVLNNASDLSIVGSSSIHAVQNSLFMNVGGTLIVTGGGFGNQMNGSLTFLSGVTNVMGGFTNSGGSVILNPSATLISDSYAQSGGSTDVSGTLSTASYKQSGGDTIIESGGTVSATTFKATGGTVTVNGTLDPTAVEIGPGATLQGAGRIMGNVSMGGTMIPGGPGAPGTVTIFGNYEQTGNGILREFISSSSNGLLSVNGDVALDSDSILSITLLGGFNPLGDTFTIMDYASLVGQFSNGSSFWDDGFLWDVNYGANQIDISAVRSPEPSSLLLLCIGFAVLALCAQRKMAKTRLFA